MKTTKQTMLKEKAKQLCCILLAAILCIGMTIPVMVRHQYNAAVSSYKKYMRGKRGSYKIVDVDGNGIPELLMHNSSAGINEVEPTIPKQEKMYG